MQQANKKQKTISNNITSFYRDVIQLEQAFYNICCRYKELQLALVYFDKEKYPSEYSFLSEDYAQIIAKFDLLAEALSKLNYKEDELKVIYMSAGVFEWERHWFYEYLTDKDPFKK